MSILNERTDEELAEAMAKHLEVQKEPDKKAIFFGAQSFSARELATALRDKIDPVYSEHVRMIRRAADKAGKDPLCWILGE